MDDDDTGDDGGGESVRRGGDADRRLDAGGWWLYAHPLVTNSIYGIWGKTQANGKIDLSTVSSEI